MALQFNPYPLQPWLLKQQEEQDRYKGIQEGIGQALSTWAQIDQQKRKQALEKQLNDQKMNQDRITNLINYANLTDQVPSELGALLGQQQTGGMGNMINDYKAYQAGLKGNRMTLRGLDEFMQTRPTQQTQELPLDISNPQTWNTPRYTAKAKDRFARIFEKTQPKEEEYAAQEYMDKTGKQRIGRWSKRTGLVQSPNDPFAYVKDTGESPTQKKVGAQTRVSGNLESLADLYAQLRDTGSIVDVNAPGYKNVANRIAASGVGQMIGGAVGTKAQSLRNQINQMRPLLIQDIRQATQMGARGLDSEKELEFYLEAATNPRRDLQANLNALQVLDRAYGLGLGIEIPEKKEEEQGGKIESQGNMSLQKPLTATNPQTGQKKTSYDGGKTWQ